MKSLALTFEIGLFDSNWNNIAGPLAPPARGPAACSTAALLSAPPFSLILNSLSCMTLLAEESTEAEFLKMKALNALVFRVI